MGLRNREPAAYRFAQNQIRLYNTENQHLTLESEKKQINKQTIRIKRDHTDHILRVIAQPTSILIYGHRFASI